MYQLSRYEAGGGSQLPRLSIYAHGKVGGRAREVLGAGRAIARHDALRPRVGLTVRLATLAVVLVRRLLGAEACTVTFTTPGR